MSGYIGPAPVPQATQTREAFTATSGQTTFNTGGYTAGYIDVFLNGVKLAAADYTATNGSDVVLATGAATGDILETVAYTAFTVADQDFTGTTTTEDLTVTGAFTSQGIDDNATSTAMTLDSSGNLLVGKTSADSSIVGAELRSGGRLFSTTSNDYTVNLNRLNSDGEIAVFRKDGTTVGSIGTFGGRIVFADSPSGVTIDDAANTFRTINASNGGARDGATDLGDASNRWKNLYLSGGVYLGGTGAANRLDEYEEGTWTPTYNGSVSDPTITYDTQVGLYVKVGSLVHLQGRLRTDALSGGSGTLRVRGLPFPNANVSGAYAGWNIVYSSGWNVGKAPNGGYINANTSEIVVIRSASSDARDNRNVSINISDMGTGANQSDILFTATYRTDA